MSSVYLESVSSGGHNFAERIGSPDEGTSALGYVIVGFSWLEESLESHIGSLAGVAPQTAPALTAELSFKTKVNVLSSLVRVQDDKHQFNAGSEDALDVWNDILKMLYRAEELRNQLLHSHWLTIGGKTMRRRKTTAKAAHGIRVSAEHLSSDYLLDVYDYILNVDRTLNEFFGRA